MTILAAVTIASVPPQPIFPADVIEHASRFLRDLATSWHEEVPIQIHSGAIDAGGAPEFHPAFQSFIERDCRKPGCYDLHCRHGQDRPNPRKKAHKALGKLRRVAPREFDALYLLVAHSMTFDDVAAALTERSIRLDKPERYDESDVLVLVVSAIDKVQGWW